MGTTVMVGCKQDVKGIEPPLDKLNVSHARSLIREDQAQYAGVGIGGSERGVRIRLGSPPTRYTPNAENSYNSPGWLPCYRRPDGWQKTYRDVEVCVAAGRVTVLNIYGRKAITARGVGTGDPIAKAARAYKDKHIQCQLEPSQPSEFVESPQCELKLSGDAHRGVFMYFGDDPIRMIILSAAPFHAPTGVMELPSWFRRWPYPYCNSHPNSQRPSCQSHS